MTNNKALWLLACLLIINGLAFSQQNNPNFKLAGYDIEIKGNFGEFSKTLEIEKIAQGLEIVTITLKPQRRCNTTRVFIELGIAFI